MRRINKIIIHCSATPEDVYFGPKQLEAMHLKRGINSPGGYHYLITNSGMPYEIRPIERIGAHIYGHNTDSVGICYSGGVVSGGNPNKASDAKDTRTNRQKSAIVSTIVYVLKVLELYQPIDHITIKGHRDFSPDVDGDGIIEPWEFMKQCPCFDAEIEYCDIFNQLAL
ncbi:N-acetylmuramoyl-L-alanine amidase [Marinoscillum furvescens]|uniref:N-acetylmuramoyl-L-alanine amidase n=1 Tax=Marinoscillum furvescens DSM 4134 TaxID=1122208 RepID=A0A3D9L731_MARFU|nr:N-acetylmuramoyl-L-alanine amidase [Marinoscillum furvescens]REE01110.1 N-acetylmuramoyl-L-alanine amidase [Marinoscillum furvescens DSM 4134]